MKVIKTKLNYSSSYNLLELSSLTVGDIIPFDIYIKKNENYVIIIEAGTLLSDTLHKKLEKWESLYTSVKDEDKKTLSCETLKYYIQYNKDDVENRLKILYSVNDKLFDAYLSNKNDRIDISCVESVVEAIIFLMKYDIKLLNKSMPFFINNDKVPTHSLHVAIYSINLGNILRFKDKELLQLGISALLHDLGLKKIDEAILNKDDQLTPEETSLMQKHSKYSVDIIKQNNIHDPYIIDAVMHHHEHYDGTGYPEQLPRAEISEFASILSICDVFDALTNNRPYRKNFSSFAALKMMTKEASMLNKFNQRYINLFLKSL